MAGIPADQGASGDGAAELESVCGKVGESQWVFISLTAGDGLSSRHAPRAHAILSVYQWVHETLAKIDSEGAPPSFTGRELARALAHRVGVRGSDLWRGRKVCSIPWQVEVQGPRQRVGEGQGAAPRTKRQGRQGKRQATTVSARQALSSEVCTASRHLHACREGGIGAPAVPWEVALSPGAAAEGATATWEPHASRA